MKTLIESILSDIDITLNDTDTKVTHVLIQKYLEDNYRGNWTISEKPNKDGLYEVSSDDNIAVSNEDITSLTNDQFIWTSVRRNFYCNSCKSLQSLKGAPKEIGGHFDCSYCKSLQSLKGAPKIVKGSFYCGYCGKVFTKDDVKKESKITGHIFANAHTA